MTVRTRVVSVATCVVVLAAMASSHAQERGRTAERSATGLYVLKVVEPGYDVTITENERTATFSVLEMNGLVPTVTASGMLLFRAVYDIARERKFEFVFITPSRSAAANAPSTRDSSGRRIAMVTKVFMTNDAKTSLKELLGADYTADAQETFDRMGYQSVTQLSKLFGGRGL